MWKARAQTDKEALLETVVWLSMFAYAPTAFEVWRFAFRPFAYAEVERMLQALVEAEVLVARHGHFVLPSEEGLFEDRELRYRDALKKLRTAERATWWLRGLRDVRAVFACNSLGMMHTRPESDIDLFVIARGGSLWRVRAMSVTPFALLGKRGTANDSADALCFSFFLSDANLRVDRFALEGGDPYLAFWLATLLPLYDPDHLMQQVFFESGVSQVFPQMQPEPSRDTVQRGWLSLPRWMEGVLERMQRAKFPEAITRKMNNGTDVVVNESVLKFHTEDGRLGYRERFLQKLDGVMKRI